MPFKSQAQRRWMYATHPKMAKKWSKHTPKGADLPDHVHEQLGPDNDEIPGMTVEPNAPNQKAEGIECIPSSEDQLNLTTTKREMESRIPSMLEVFRRKSPWNL